MKISEIELHPIEHLFSTKASNQTEILLSLLDPRFHFQSVMLAVSFYSDWDTMVIGVERKRS